MSARVCCDLDGTFYVYPDGGAPAEHHTGAVPPQGWRYRVTMHDHKGDAYDRETGEEWVVQPPDGWWGNADLIADAVIEVSP